MPASAGFVRLACGVAFVALFGSGARAAQTQQHAASPHGRQSFSPRVPADPQHAEYVVEINRKGQVIRVRSGKASRDLAFNTMTYGNALQAFIRTADGRAIPGVYRLGYDYAPRSRNVRRSVAFLHAGGVNPDTPGAVDRMAADARRRASQASAPASPLPDFESIEKSH